MERGLAAEGPGVVLARRAVDEVSAMVDGMLVRGVDMSNFDNFRAGYGTSVVYDNLATGGTSTWVFEGDKMLGAGAWNLGPLLAP